MMEEENSVSDDAESDIMDEDFDFEEEEFDAGLETFEDMNSDEDDDFF